MRYLCEFMVRHRMLVDEAPTTKQAAEHAKRYLAQKYPSSILLSVEPADSASEPAAPQDAA